MMAEDIQILLVEDNEGDAFIIKEYLSEIQDKNFLYSISETLESAKEQLRSHFFDIILLDLNLPDSNGIDTLKSVIKFRQNAAIILLTGIHDERIGMDAVQLGAQDYLVKNNINAEILYRTINYAISRNKDQLKLQHVNKVLQTIRSINQFITKIDSIDELIRKSCELFVSSNVYSSAWIILVDNNHNVSLSTQKGILQNKFDEFLTNFNNKIYPNCLQLASKFSDHVISHGNDNSCTNCPIFKKGNRKAAYVKKLYHKKNLLGYIGVSINSEYANNEDEKNLFIEVTDDIAFSLYTINQSIEKQILNKKYQDEQKKLNALVNNLPGIAFRCKYDKSLTMEYLSKGCKTVLGYESDDLINNNKISFFEIIHPDDRLRVRNEIETIEKKQNRFSVEFRVITKDQKEKWVLKLCSPDYDAKKNITHLDGYITEITDKKNAQLTLEKSEEKYRLLAENSVNCIWTMDKRLRFTYASPSLKNILGYTQEEFIGKPLYKFTHRNAFIKMARIALRTLTNPKEYPLAIFESVMISKSGEKVPVEITGKALMDIHGNLIGLQGTTKDITERVLSNKALLESEHKFRILYENSPDMYASISPETGSILLCNKTFLQILKYDKKEVIGKPVSNFYHEDSQSDAKLVFEEFVKNGFIKEKELKLKRRNGDPLDVSLSVNAVRDEKGKILYSISSWRDISEKKRTEKLLREQNEKILTQIHEYEALNEEYLALNEDLHSSNENLQIINKQLIEAKELAEQNEKLKSVFMANMSHEIRTPMNAIIGFSSFLGDDSLPYEKKRNYIKHIKNAGNRLLQVINDIIDISKIEANQLSISFEDCNICSVIKSSYESFLNDETFINKPGLQLIPIINPDLMDLNIKADFTRLSQVFDNLISNAIKYTEKGSIEFGCNIKKSEWVEFYVKDTGIGIPEDKKDLVFERFRQVEELEYHEGSGLGLSIAKGIVELMNGKIWFESEHGKGSTFYFSIPYEPAFKHNQVEINEKISSIDLSNTKILIAEDDMSSYEYLKLLLEETKAAISHVSNGQELMERISDINPDILLLDINMPVKSGFVCLKEFKERHIYNQFKIIAQTAYTMKGEKEKCLAEGCHEYIAKPFSKEELFSKISNVINIPVNS